MIFVLIVTPFLADDYVVTASIRAKLAVDAARRCLIARLRTRMHVAEHCMEEECLPSAIHTYFRITKLTRNLYHFLALLLLPLGVYPAPKV